MMAPVATGTWDAEARGSPEPRSSVVRPCQHIILSQREHSLADDGDLE